MPITEKQKQNLKPIKKGEVRNPKGINGSEALLTIRRLTKEELVDLGSLILRQSIAELQKVATSPTESALKVMVASVAIKIINKGDMAALDILLDRLIGKVPQAVKLSGAVATNAMVTVNLPANSRESGKQ